ncbi:Hypothetical predicted protein [Mytilus galloprovincialis]|uniref:ZMYM2-like/QRICH1 C-terminal domain-containing protein n=1 Tax=Mytilus galloprovincialis TaxID=29158 RepID=A0A8B6E020_MYTGA|nr:Hypothetical predicted protein [Mytilus galloprovincialis]
MNARKQDGKHYKATSFEIIRHVLNRHLRGVPYSRKIDIIKDTEFSDANECFKAALAELNRIGKGSVDHHPVINETDRKKLYESIIMIPDAPEALLNKVQFDIRLYFCGRSQENMHGMTKSTFEVLNDPKTGLWEYVAKCKDELTKNHRGNDRESTSGVMPEFPGSPYCPVKSYETYISKLHPLWQRPKESFNDDDTIWYCNSRLGEKTLAKFMTKLSEGAKLSQIYTNHSIRATGATILTKSMFNPSQIMAVTGHKSVQSLNVYQRTDTEEKIAMGHAMGKALQLLINVNQSDYVPYITSEAGIRLSIHEHDSEPVLENNGFSVATGFRTDVSLSQFENFLSNIGGLLGLWIGMSAISIGELLELCFFLLRSMTKRNRAIENQTGVSSNEIGETTDQNITQSVHIDMSIIDEMERGL